MAHNPSKNNNNNSSIQTVLSHSRSISSIPNHQNHLSFMPKFLLKTLQKKKKKQNQRCSVSIGSGINGNNNPYYLSRGNGGNREKFSKIDKQCHGHKYQIIPIPRRISSIMSNLLSNNKSRDQQQFKDVHRPCLVEQAGSLKGHNWKIMGSRCSSSSSSPFSSLGSDKKHGLSGNSNSDSDHVKVGDVVSLSVNGGKTSRVKLARKKGMMIEAKVGFRVKGIIKIKRREKRVKRFELCKKKILMGEKCMPLNGVLCYDKNGILIPEDLIE